MLNNLNTKKTTYTLFIIIINYAIIINYLSLCINCYYYSYFLFTIIINRINILIMF